MATYAPESNFIFTQERELFPAPIFPPNFRVDYDEIEEKGQILLQYVQYAQQQCENMQVPQKTPSLRNLSLNFRGVPQNIY